MAQDKMVQRLKLDGKIQTSHDMDTLDEKMFTLGRVVIRHSLSEMSNEKRERYYEVVKHLDGSNYQNFKVMQRELLNLH